MEIQQYSDASTLNITIIGRLDTMSAPQAESILNEILQTQTHIVCDFEQLDYISSAGLRIMLMLAKKMDQRNGDIQIKNMNDEVYEVFEITAMCDLFDIVL